MAEDLEVEDQQTIIYSESQMLFSFPHVLFLSLQVVLIAHYMYSDLCKILIKHSQTDLLWSQLVLIYSSFNVVVTNNLLVLWAQGFVKSCFVYVVPRR